MRWGTHLTPYYLCVLPREASVSNGPLVSETFHDSQTSDNTHGSVSISPFIPGTHLDCKRLFMRIVIPFQTARAIGIKPLIIDDYVLVLSGGSVSHGPYQQPTTIARGLLKVIIPLLTARAIGINPLLIDHCASFLSVRPSALEKILREGGRKKKKLDEPLTPLARF